MCCWLFIIFTSLPPMSSVHFLFRKRHFRVVYFSLICFVSLELVTFFFLLSVLRLLWFCVGGCFPSVSPQVQSAPFFLYFWGGLPIKEQGWVGQSRAGRGGAELGGAESGFRWKQCEWKAYPPGMTQSYTFTCTVPFSVLRAVRFRNKKVDLRPSTVYSHERLPNQNSRSSGMFI